MTTDLHSMLAPEGAGGVLEGPAVPDVAALAATANEYGARFAELDGPTSISALIDALERPLGLPEYTGRNWDALDEVLSYPEGAAGGPAIVAWLEPDRLPAADAAIFRAVVERAAEIRAGQGMGALVLAVDPPRTPAEGDGAASLPLAVRALGRIHHVALIVASIEEALGFWRDTLGAPLETVMDIGQDRVRIAFLTVGESKIELVEPTDETTGVARFLAGKGEGFHHVCLEVDDLAATLTRLAEDGLELIDPAPRRGAEGPVAFIHPRSCHGVLVELIEAPGGPSWAASGFPSQAEGASA